VCLLVLQLNDLETVVTVFELMLTCALLDVMFEELGDFHILRAESAIRYELALLGQVEVI
jgi:hypothetical protein